MLIKILKDVAHIYLPIYRFSELGKTVLYAGYSEEQKNYFGLLPFKSNSVLQTYLGMKYFKDIPHYIESHADIGFAETGNFSERYFSAQNGFMLPEWAQMYLDIPQSLESLCRGRKTTFHEIRRLIGKYNLTYKINNGRNTFQHFYRSMYLPYLKKRHDQEACIQGESEIVRFYHEASLLSVYESDCLVSAVIFWVKNNCLYMHRLGVVNGDMSHVKHGAIGALYYFSVTEAIKMNCTQLDIGGTRPFIHNGVTHFKLGLSARFYTIKNPLIPQIWLGIKSNSEIAYEFLEQNPFVYYEHSKNLIVPQQCLVFP